MAQIYVTQPYLPPIDEFIPYLRKIWSNKILTNGGEFHVELEKELCKYLGVKYISLFTNGTIALTTALQALGIEGEVITTPYSFVATSHSLLWNGVKPVFVDIDPITLNLDPENIRAAITPRTKAILPVHCYGYSCNVAEIQKIADEFNLKIIYDAAHAFGVTDENGSILNHGDLSVLSFHATKVFNTFEGGAIICHDHETKAHIDQLKNFGFTGELTVEAAGINGKMSEFNAALGLLQLKYIDQAIDARKNIDSLYRSSLKNVIGIRCLNDLVGSGRANYSYFPILVEESFRMSRDDLHKQLLEIGINTRRYFYPLISNFPMYSGLPSSDGLNLPNATRAALQVLCLPIYPDLDIKVVDKLCSFIAGK